MRVVVAGALVVHVLPLESVYANSPGIAIEYSVSYAERPQSPI